jgi:AcrR family transcriptional regulator
MSQVFTIATVMRRTGASRSSIHFYLREALLPQPQKTSANRSLYTEHHVELLHEIARLKQEGLSLAQIKDALRDHVSAIEQKGADLAEQEDQRVRRAILRTATEEFMANGYRQTRVADIIRKSGVTSQTFYSHFPSKDELLVESFRTFIRWNLAFIEPRLAETADLGERLLWRILADYRANQLGSEVLSLVRSDNANGTDLARLVEQTWGDVVRRIVDDFEEVRKKAPAIAAEDESASVSLELLAYSMIGAQHNASLRASWDDRFTREQVVATHLWLYLAALASLSGEIDIDSRLARYRDLIRQVTARQPETPPAIED